VSGFLFSSLATSFFNHILFFFKVMGVLIIPTVLYFLGM